MKLPDTLCDLVAGVFRLITRGSECPVIRLKAGVSLSVEARGTSKPHVVALETSKPYVEARGTSQPHVVARGYVQLSLIGAIIAKVSAKVSVLVRGAAKVTGGRQTRVRLATAEDWCEFYGVTVAKGVATLYKAVNREFRSKWNGGLVYAPGTAVVASDWDGGNAECGGGLHFSPSASAARGFSPDAPCFVECAVRLKDLRPPKDTDMYPSKIKARACRVVREVTLNGSEAVE